MPVVDGGQRAYFEAYFAHLGVAMPLAVADAWALPDMSDALQERVVGAWAALKAALARDANARLREAPAPVVFVAIPKTGTRTVLTTLRKAGVAVQEGQREANGGAVFPRRASGRRP